MAPPEAVSVILAEFGASPGVDYPASIGAAPFQVLFSRWPGGVVLARCNYVGCAGWGDKDDVRKQFGPGGTSDPSAARNYDGIFAYNPDDPQNAHPVPKDGADAPPPRGVKLEEIKDGMGNTLMFVETAGGYLNPRDGFTGAQAYLNDWNIPAWASNAWISSFGTCPDPANPNCSVPGSRGRGLSWGLPGSFHAANRINVAYCDGSVRSIPGDINFALYVSLSGYRDGDMVQVD